jgi:hypothetical protein
MWLVSAPRFCVAWALLYNTPMNRVVALLTLALTAAPLGLRAESVSGGRVALTQKVRQVDLYAAARAQLQRERTGLAGRSAQLNAAIVQAKIKNRSMVQNASLQGLLQEALEVSQQLDATDRKLAVLDRMMRDTVTAVDRAVADLPSAERASARADVERVRLLLPHAEVEAASQDVLVSSGMDTQALQERADLAGDYEDKLLREAALTEARLRELNAQASMVTEAQNLAMDRRLFDEEDRTFQATRVVGRTVPSGTNKTDTAANGNQGGTRNEGAQGAPSEPGALGEFDGTGSPGNGPQANPTPTVTPSGGMGRSQVVVDQRTLVLLREARPVPGALSPEDELAQLQSRRVALLKAASRLRALREELNARARAQQTTKAPARQ